MTSDPQLRVAVLTTYYPRHEDDFAGRFVADLVEHVEALGVQFDIVKPGVYHDYGLAYGSGVVRNAKRRPWLIPLLLFSMARALRRAARTADLVHIHWLLAAPLGLLTGKPWVVTLHGTPTARSFEDLVLLRRAKWLVGPVLRRAKGVIWLEFAELFEKPRSQMDYLEIASTYHTVLISNVRVMSPAQSDVVRRFTWLVDVFYDQRVKLVMSAEARPEALIADAELDDAAARTVQREFARTVSRLVEMQSHDYFSRKHASAENPQVLARS